MNKSNHKSQRDLRESKLAVAPSGPVGDIYEVNDWSGISAFLTDYPHVSDLLLEARSTIETLWGPGSRAQLEILEDPDSPESKEAFCFIHTKLEPESAMSQLESFDRLWWLDAVQRAKGKLNFALRYD